MMWFPRACHAYRAKHAPVRLGCEAVPFSARLRRGSGKDKRDCGPKIGEIMDTKPMRTTPEKQVGQNIAHIFENCPDATEVKLENFPKYVRRQQLKRFLAMYEIFKLVLPLKGSIVECGVFRGFGLMAWAKLSAMLEPENLTRRVYGFDTFGGFPASIHEKDHSSFATPQPGELASDSFDELQQLIKEYDSDRFLGHVSKVKLVRGDMTQTIPEFVTENPHLIVSLLFIDCDLYAPTSVALNEFLPRMPRGSIVAFDDLDNPIWPGETLALLDSAGLGKLRLQRLEWDPYIAYCVVE
jgi:hypothetical protein